MQAWTIALTPSTFTALSVSGVQESNYEIWPPVEHQVLAADCPADAVRIPQVAPFDENLADKGLGNIFPGKKQNGKGILGPPIR